jgi:hypothetical protein
MGKCKKVLAHILNRQAVSGFDPQSRVCQPCCGLWLGKWPRTKELERDVCFILYPFGFFFFLEGLWYWGLNSGLGACKAGALPLEPQLQSILLWVFWRWGLMSCLPELASSLSPPDVSLPDSWDYRDEPLVPACFDLFF